MIIVIGLIKCLILMIKRTYIDFKEVTLGDDEYFVMGDNRPYSKDSRYVGPVKKSQIFAKKMLVLLPISDIGVKD